ncbi:MAG: two component regulator propeller [Phycisphaerales bacterium]|nr:two component regulator propeller [Phycisphaerales bacterium]
MPRTVFDAYVKQGRSTWATDRRQADWNDAGEQFPKTHEGPDLYISVDVPTGEYTLSLYDYNKDGHGLNNAYRGRDMTVSIFSRPVGSPLAFVQSGAVNTEKPVVRRRLRDFWGGMYQRFYVRGPAVVTIGCRRINSANLMLSAVLLDKLDERPAPFDTQSSTRPRVADSLPPVYAAGRALLDAECERFNLAGKAPPAGRHPLPDPETCQFSLWQFAAWERSQEAHGLRSIRSIEQALRWDGVRQVTKGKELEILSEYLTKHPN